MQVTSQAGSRAAGAVWPAAHEQSIGVVKRHAAVGATQRLYRQSRGLLGLAVPPRLFVLFVTPKGLLRSPTSSGCCFQHEATTAAFLHWQHSTKTAAKTSLSTHNECCSACHRTASAASTCQHVVEAVPRRRQAGRIGPAGLIGAWKVGAICVRAARKKAAVEDKDVSWDVSTTPPHTHMQQGRHKERKCCLPQQPRCTHAGTALLAWQHGRAGRWAAY